MYKIGLVEIINESTRKVGEQPGSRWTSLTGKVKELLTGIRIVSSAVTVDVGTGIIDDDRIGAKGDIVTAFASSDVEWL